MSTAPLPGPGQSPERLPSKRPVVVEPPPKKPRSLALFGITAAVVAAIGTGLFIARDSVFKGGGGGEGPAKVASATVSTGSLDRSVRLTGTISAERFAALMAPQLRGSRTGRGTGGSSRRSSGGSAVVSSSSGSSSGSSSSSGTASASSATLSSDSSSSGNSSGSGSGTTSGSSNAGMNAGIGAGAASLGAIRGTTNRFSDRSSQTRSTTTGSGSSGSSSSSALGSSGLGSTSGSLFSASSTGGSGGGGGGGGGTTGGRGNDFMLVILSLATPGAMVRKGDVVAEFDRQYMLNRLDDYRASVNQIAADLKKLEADQAVQLEAKQQALRVAKADLEKATLDLKTIEIASDMDAERLKLAAEEAGARYKQLVEEMRLFRQSLQSEMRSAEIELNQSRIELKRAEQNADRLLIKAPMDGIVVMQSIRRGGEMGQAQQGDQIYPGQMFMQIVDPSSMVVNAQVNQVDSESMRIGQKAKVQLDAFPGLTLDAKVFSIGAVPVAGRRPNYMKQIPVRLKLESQDNRVIPDLSASADVVVGQELQATLVPVQSIFREAGKPFVFLQNGAAWQKTPVELGVQNSLFVAVRSGVKAGDVVAMQPTVAAKNESAQPAS